MCSSKNLIATMLLLAASAAAQGKVFMRMDEALKLAFPKCKVQRTMKMLGTQQRQAVRKLCGKKCESRLIYPYLAYKKGKLVGTAYFDRHRVRTLSEVLMVVVTPDHRIRRIEVLAFAEPTDYIPGGTWYAQFLKHKLNKRLNLKLDIRGVTGATLTARATTDCARRVLAIHRVLNGVARKPKKAREAKTGKPQSKPTTEPVTKKSSRRQANRGKSKQSQPQVKKVARQPSGKRPDAR